MESHRVRGLRESVIQAGRELGMLISREKRGKREERLQATGDKRGRLQSLKVRKTNINLNQVITVFNEVPSVLT